MATRQRPVSGTELEVLKVLWKIGPSKVRAVQTVFHEKGRKLAYTTVLTLMHRLLEKGYVKADTSQFAHVFHPSDSREEFIFNRVRDLSSQTGVPMNEVRSIVAQSKPKRSKSKK